VRPASAGNDHLDVLPCQAVRECQFFDGGGTGIESRSHRKDSGIRRLRKPVIFASCLCSLVCAPLRMHIPNVSAVISEEEMSASRKRDPVHHIEALTIIPNTRWRVADMAYQLFLHGSVPSCEAPSSAMGQSRSAILTPDQGVSAIVQRALPQPARSKVEAVFRDGAILVDLWPEALSKRADYAPIARAGIATKQRGWAPMMDQCGRLARESFAAFLTDPNDWHTPSYSEEV
jgi:hypothetical protein